VKANEADIALKYSAGIHYAVAIVMRRGAAQDETVTKRPMGGMTNRSPNTQRGIREAAPAIANRS
jgi:hypothetical protein